MQNIILFDGVCNMCNSTVDFLIKIDKNRTLKFASLQSDFAKEKLKPFQTSLQTIDSIVFWSNKKIYTEADAVIEILKTIGGFWKFMALIFQIIPKFLRNAMYHFVAKNRYKFFGKRNSCRVPNEEEKERYFE
jgi:predicted DCC family thiol-disulfide oxidoreductase YuxK